MAFIVVIKCWNCSFKKLKNIDMAIKIIIKKKACWFKCCVITPSEMWNIENKNKHIVFILEIKWRPQSQDLRNSWDSSPLTGQSQSSCLLLGLHRHLILHKWVFQTPPAEERMQRGNSSSVKGQLSTHTVEGGRSGATHPLRDTAAVWWSCGQNGDAQGRDMMLLGLLMPVSSLVFSKWRWLTPPNVIHFAFHGKYFPSDSVQRYSDIAATGRDET